MSQQDERAINPHLSDLFRTAIQGATPAQASPPSIVVTGSHNVISWGGTVYMRDAHGTDEARLDTL